MSLPRLAPLAAAIGIALAAPAQAINLAPNGKGEVLIFPYYTVRSGFDTILSVTNASDRTVLAALRLREANNGRTVGELHLVLSPHDMWTAGVTTDGGSGAYLRSFDTSCTAPAMPAGPSGSKQVALSAGGYDGTGALPYDNGGSGLARVQEGFIEIIEMGISTVPETSIPTGGSSIESASQHVAGVPRNCAFVAGEFADAANFAESGSGTALAGAVFSDFEAPKNVLFGSATLINVSSGHAYDAAPTVIQNFRNTTPLVYRPAAGKPTLASGDANMTVSRLDREGAPVTTAPIASPVDAVSVLLMADSLNNEYAIGSTATSGARTDWVVTLPTKHFYTDEAEAGASAPLPPFTQAFVANGKSCDNFFPYKYDREAKTAVIPGSTQFGGQPPWVWNTLCRNANVVAWTAGEPNPAGVLGSGGGQSVDTSTVGTAGWVELSFPLTNFVRPDPPPVFRSALLGYAGLPAIGFSVIERNNSAQSGNNRNYGSGRPHVVKLITP